MSSNKECNLSKEDWELLLSRVNKAEYVQTIKLFKRNSNRPIALQNLPLTVSSADNFRNVVWRTKLGIAFRVAKGYAIKKNYLGMDVYQKQRYHFVKSKES